MVSEYGVGAATVTPVKIAEAAPATIDDVDIQAYLASHLAGAHPGWPAPDTSSIYLFIYPTGTKVTDKGATGCTQFEGYHGETAISSGGDAGTSIQVAYAVDARCSGSGMGSTLDTAAWSATHEILEAVTDPFPKSAPAFRGVDDESAPWTLFTAGTEVADLCFMNFPALEPTSKHYLARVYSNVAAKAGKNPCVPAAPNEPGPFFQAVPVLPDAVSFTYKTSTAHVHGLKVPAGTKGTLEIDLASGGATKPIQIDLYGYQEMMGQKPSLKFTLDRPSGVNGEKLYATVEVLAKDTSLGAEPFLVVATVGEYVTYSVGTIGY